MKLHRRTFLTAGASAFASIGFVRQPAEAAQFELKYASAQQPDNPVTVAITAAVEKIKNESGGRVQISFFSPTACWAAIRRC